MKAYLRVKFILHLLKTVETGLVIIGSTFEKSVIAYFHKDKHKPAKGFSQFLFSDSNFLNGIYINGTEDPFADSPFVEQINC